MLLLLKTLNFFNMSIQKWIIDPNPSEIPFNVNHLINSIMPGDFKKLPLTLKTEGNDFTIAKKSL